MYTNTISENIQIKPIVKVNEIIGSVGFENWDKESNMDRPEVRLGLSAYVKNGYSWDKTERVETIIGSPVAVAVETSSAIYICDDNSLGYRMELGKRSTDR